MHPRPCLALSGFTASGKTTAASYLVAQIANAQLISTGSVVRNLLSERGLQFTHENLQRLNEEIVKKHGSDYLSIITPFIRSEANLVLIDAIRTVNDLRFLERMFNRVFSLAILAQEETRWTRICNRRRRGDPVSFQEFRNQIERENNWGVLDIISTARQKICNDSTIEAFHRYLDQTIQAFTE